MSKWQPLQRGKLLAPSEELIQTVLKKMPMLTRSGALAYLDREMANTEHWLNDLYQVEVRRFNDGMVHLNIRRRDGKEIYRDWRHFQRIKNELVGAECEGIELYPAESRLVDTSNKYHIYCVADPTFRFPIGFQTRDVVTKDDAVKPGLKQRPIETEE